jgi:hypothetical protein
MDYEQKYLKYKKKYIMLRNSIGGGGETFIDPNNENSTISIVENSKNSKNFDLTITTPKKEINKTSSYLFNLIKITNKNFKNVKKNDGTTFIYKFRIEKSPLFTRYNVNLQTTYKHISFDDKTNKITITPNTTPEGTPIQIPLDDFIKLIPVMIKVEKIKKSKKKSIAPP